MNKVLVCLPDKTMPCALLVSNPNPINQSINQPINQSINQSINHPRIKKSEVI